MTNPKGGLYERLVREYLRDQQFRVEHLRKAGKADLGDLFVHEANTVLELKDHAKINLPEFLRQAELEATNYADAHRLDVVPAYAVVVKARRQHVGRSFVVTHLDEWIRQCQA